MYRCPNCGGDMQFSPEKQKLVCAYCDSEFTVEEFDKRKGVNASEHKDVYEDADHYRATIFTCPQCGGEIISTSDTAATFCSFCGASVLLESRVSDELKPDMIIPFRVTREQCRDAYLSHVKKSLFVPSKLKSDNEISKFRSIYMPYWIYSYDYDGRINVKGKTTYRRGDYVYTKHYNIASNARLDYDGIAYDASSSFADNLSSAVAPFDLKKAKSFKSAYMTGHYADTRDVDSDLYESDAADVVRSHAANALAENRGYAEYGADTSDIAMGFEPALRSAKLGFFPVWFLSSRNAKGDRVSYAAINGQTGKVAADMPVSFLKYLIGSLLLAIPIFLLLSFVVNVTFTPRVMLIIAMILGVFAIAILNSQLNKVYTRENNLDDKGWQAIQGRGFVNRKKTIKTKKGEINVDAKDILSSLGCGGYVFLIIFGIGGIVALVGSYLPYIIVGIIVFVIIRSVYKSNSGKALKAETFPAPFKEKIGKLIKPIAGIAISLVTIVLNPFEDTIYYACALVSLFLVVWSFRDMIKAHNRLTLRKLPQLGRRGGDENA